MKLIIGLGNLGLKYKKTRHNLGFMVVDFLVKKGGGKFNLEKKYKAEVARQKTRNTRHEILFIKPQDFYNNSGEVIAKLAKFYKVEPYNVLVIADDLNLDFGVIRYREKGSGGGNNGLKSIISHLGTEDFPRIRIGTNSNLREKIGDTKFVLSRLKSDESKKLPKIFEEISGKVDEFINK